MATDWTDAGLPNRPLVQGYEEGRQDVKIADPVEVGTPKIRKRFTDAPDTFTCAYELTGSEKETLVTFWVTTIDEGTDSFTFPDPADGSTAITVVMHEYPRITGVAPDLYRCVCKLTEALA